MKYSIIPVLFLLIISSCITEESETWTLIPYPNSVSIRPGSFHFDQGITILSSSDNLNHTISIFKKKLNDLEIDANSDSEKIIELDLSSSCGKKSESYELRVGKERIRLTATDPKGIFYGLMTIWQQLRFSNSKTIPCGYIKDEPRFEYRGFMLDESRHFFGKEKVIQLIDLMATFKLNTFHWHLTDESGWRVEIKAYPRLSTIGGKGNADNPNAPSKYYTLEEIKEIVVYAANRHITIIPEIDMPGHASAANRAYPEFSGGGSERRPDWTFDIGKESTYRYLNSILEEVAGLFPSKYIHLGGDEVHFGNEKWSTNDSIQSLMKREGLQTLVEVEHYFTRTMAAKLLEMDKELAGWDEIIESDVSNNKTLVYWWRHDKEEQLQKSLTKGYNTILCPRIPLYFDFVQHNTHSNGRRWDGDFSALEDVYQYPDSTHNFSDEEMDLIKGIQANLWTEKFDTEIWVDFMTFPRLLALSESAWTMKSNKDFSRFTKNLPGVFEFLEEQRVYYFNSLFPTHNIEPTTYLYEN
ncbi:MAG: beta-N-acetylhexosaminidase [Bacteroidetes bacterium]|nr:beta-N-acetylhexosaminidase [Bacteroidota bacterium]